MKRKIDYREKKFLSERIEDARMNLFDLSSDAQLTNDFFDKWHGLQVVVGQDQSADFSVRQFNFRRLNVISTTLGLEIVIDDYFIFIIVDVENFRRTGVRVLSRRR